MSETESFNNVSRFSYEEQKKTPIKDGSALKPQTTLITR